jgi:hypothetical protein
MFFALIHDDRHKSQEVTGRESTATTAATSQQGGQGPRLAVLVCCPPLGTMGKELRILRPLLAVLLLLVQRPAFALLFVLAAEEASSSRSGEELPAAGPGAAAAAAAGAGAATVTGRIVSCSG